ncbi:hypothetical protein ACV3O0_17025 [Clostridium perfringens]
MHSFYEVIETIFCIIGLITVILMALSLSMKRRYSSYRGSTLFNVSIGVSIITLIIIGAMGIGRKSFYTKTDCGRTYSIKAADAYLSKLYPKNEFKMDSMDTEGTVKYTVWIDEKPLNKQINFDEYSKKNNEKNSSDTDIRMLPIFLPIN